MSVITVVCALSVLYKSSIGLQVSLQTSTRLREGTYLDIRFASNVAVVDSVVSVKQVIRRPPQSGSFIRVSAVASKEDFFGATVGEFEEALDQDQFESFVKEMLQAKEAFFSNLVTRYASTVEGTSEV
jgi:hypothetical protein